MVKGYYKQIEGVRLPVWIYPAEGEKKFSDTLILCIHGGGWYAVKNNEDWDGGWMRYQAEYYSGKGFCAAVISYRSIDFSENTSVLDQIEDCLDAVEYLKEKTGFKKLVLMGDSAGAQLSAMLTFKNPELAAAAVLCSLVADCTGEKWAYLGEEETRKSISPLYAATGTKTKYIVMHGEQDTVAQMSAVLDFLDNMRKKGNDCKFIPIPSVGHAFILKGYVSDDESLCRYMSEIDSFLEKNILEGET